MGYLDPAPTSRKLVQGEKEYKFKLEDKVLVFLKPIF